MVCRVGRWCWDEQLVDNGEIDELRLNDDQSQTLWTKKEEATNWWHQAARYVAYFEKEKPQNCITKVTDAPHKISSRQCIIWIHRLFWYTCSYGVHNVVRITGELRQPNAHLALSNTFQFTVLFYVHRLAELSMSNYSPIQIWPRLGRLHGQKLHHLKHPSHIAIQLLYTPFA